MNDSQKRFVQRLLKPFDSFVERLVDPFCFSAKYSSLTVGMEDIATSVAHFLEGEMPETKSKEARSRLEASQPSLKRLRDFSDTRKHGSLKDPNREMIASVKSRFEYCATRGFRFLQTIPELSYKIGTRQPFDFVSLASSGISSLDTELGIGVKSHKTAPVSTEPFREAATLWHDPKSEEMHVEAVRLEFVIALENGTFLPIDPPEVRFELY